MANTRTPAERTPVESTLVKSTPTDGALKVNMFAIDDVTRCEFDNSYLSPGPVYSAPSFISSAALQLRIQIVSCVGS